MLILSLRTFGMSSIVEADLESYTYYQRCRIVVLSHSRSLVLPFCRTPVPHIVLWHGRSVALSSSQSILSDSQSSLGFLDSCPLALPSSRIVVLLHSRSSHCSMALWFSRSILSDSQCSLRFSNSQRSLRFSDSRPLALWFLTSFSRIVVLPCLCILGV